MVLMALFRCRYLKRYHVVKYLKESTHEQRQVRGPAQPSAAGQVQPSAVAALP